eukprot:scaffold101124_cov66-Cyclotella_meneghiniana.AAC.2
MAPGGHRRSGEMATNRTMGKKQTEHRVQQNFIFTRPYIIIFQYQTRPMVHRVRDTRTSRGFVRRRAQWLRRPDTASEGPRLRVVGPSLAKP